MQNVEMNEPLDLTEPGNLSAPIAKRLLHQEIVDRLRDMIVQGELAPGARLNERVLCEKLGASRTPLREAMKTLASEGLVELAPNRGASVTPLTLGKVRQIFEVLGALEGLAGELACRNIKPPQLNEIRALHYQMLAHHARGELNEYFRANQQIHIKIVEASGNEALMDTYRGLNAHVLRARYMANLSHERWDRAVKEHEQMLDALTRGDSAGLQSMLREHLGQKMLAVLNALERRDLMTESTESTESNSREAA
jgi:DNA-binding GntR family transcriptional regulator